MAAISESIVREFLEFHGFLVRQQRKFIAPSRREDEEIDFFAVHPAREVNAPDLPFILGGGDMARLARAVVAVKGWHTETFSPAVLAHAPEIFRFTEPEVFRQAEKVFGTGRPVARILVVPALPKDAESRRQSILLLKDKGVSAVLPFHGILADLVDRVEVNRNYRKSDLLQVLRILKNYDFFKEPQLELFPPPRRRPTRKGERTD